jgi:hypothetical protein
MILPVHAGNGGGRSPEKEGGNAGEKRSLDMKDKDKETGLWRY